MQLFGLCNYLKGMDNKYITLHTLAEISQEAPNPVQYLCTPREMILHSTFDWDLIHKHLTDLEAEGLVKMIKADTFLYTITQSGLDKISATQQKPAKELLLSFRDEVISK